MGSYDFLSQMRKAKSKVIGSLSKIISLEVIESAFKEHTIRKRVYPAPTLFRIMFHQSVVGCSCSESIAWARGSGLVPPHVSPKTSAYCNSKNRLSEIPLYELLMKSGRLIEDKADKRRRPFGRDVVVVDGTSVQLPDTEANQSEYPQPGSQAPGCGQPVMYIMALMGLGSGGIIEVRVSGGATGVEKELFRNMWPSLKEGQIVLADAGLTSYAYFACLEERGVDMVMAQKDAVLNNKIYGEILENDFDVVWENPGSLMKWIDHQSLPESICLRAIKYTYTGKNRVVKEGILFTTLRDRKKYPTSKVIDLLKRRWEIELNFADIKTAMGLSYLKCKTPDRCRKELYMGLLAYNVIRGVMLDAALKARLQPRRISFTKSLDYILNYFTHNLFDGDWNRTYNLILSHLGDNFVKERPGRWEPRKLKRRPVAKRMGYLTESRDAFKHAVLEA